MRALLLTSLLIPATTAADRIGSGNPNNVMQLVAGDGATCVVRHSGQVTCWGQIFYGNGVDVAVPTAIAITDAQAIAVNGEICAIRAKGVVTCWPTGRVRNQATAGKLPAVTLTDVAGIHATGLALGSGSSCASTGTGIACWGRNDLGQGATGDTKDLLAPKLVTGLSDATRIANNAYSYCAVDRAGKAQCWGRNAKGELGDGTTTNRLAPTKVAKLGTVNEIALGSSHGCAASAGKVSCWGDNAYGQLGDGTMTAHRTPGAITDIPTVIHLAAGGAGTCVIDHHDALWCWGDAAVDPKTRSTPTKQFADRAAMVSVGTDHTCALLVDETVRCWGNNAHGQLGTGTIAKGRFGPSIVKL